MPDHRCEMVVQTAGGRRRCSNPVEVETGASIDANGRGIPPAASCRFHHENGNAPQCVEVVYLIRCSVVAVCLPIHDPQFCQNHGRAAEARIQQERERQNRAAYELRRHPVAFSEEYVCLFTVPTDEHPEGTVPPARPEIVMTPREAIRERVDQEFHDLNEQARRIREAADAAALARADLETPEVVDPELEECLVIGCENPTRAGSEFCVGHQDCSIYNGEIIRGEPMPSVTISQAATPFVAALVERLGGEVTVPARRCSPILGDLNVSRVSGGIRFALLNRTGVVRGANWSPMAAVQIPPPPVSVAIERKVEIEKIFDEAAQEAGTTLIRCAECGLRYDRTFKGPTGGDECPICELRRREANNRDQEFRELKLRLEGYSSQINVLNAEKVRLSEMVQQKLSLIADQSTTIKGLREKLRGQATTPAPAPVESRPAVVKVSKLDRIIAFRNAHPGISVVDAKARVEAEIADEERHRPMVAPQRPANMVRGGLRERVEAVVREFGAFDMKHEMSVDFESDGREIERHKFNILLPLRSQLEMGPEQTL